jgi:type I restriction-modification system DNA methylase subunit/restriction endonuclease S subunit
MDKQTSVQTGPTGSISTTYTNMEQTGPTGPTCSSACHIINNSISDQTGPTGSTENNGVEYKFICDKCKKGFMQKIDYTRHNNKKTPCITLEQMKNYIISNNNIVDNKNKLTSIFKSCLNILRDKEHLTGDKALRTLAYLLNLKLLEPQFDTNINIDNYNYILNIEDENYDKFKTLLLKVVRFSNLKTVNDDNLAHCITQLWEGILSQHPITQKIFKPGKGFDIKNVNTFKKLIIELSKFEPEDYSLDILGGAYEEVIKDVMTGKVLGQFFTPVEIKKFIVELINPQVFPDGKIETICDPAMGTGGFLITGLRHIIKQSETKNINLDWDFITNGNGVYGREPEPDTYQLALSNMMISSGKMFSNIENGDSIRNTIKRKFDIIMANPPFGIKGLDYLEIRDVLRDEYMPIESKNAVLLFIQAIIYMLNIGGRAGIVVPDGKEIFSKTDASIIRIREYLMKTCELKEVISLPAGLFANAKGIKTQVLYFHKRREGYGDALKIVDADNVKNGKLKRTYTFTKTHQTSKVDFYEFNPINNGKTLITSADISTIEKNSYSLNYTDYIEGFNDTESNADADNNDIDGDSSNNGSDNSSVKMVKLGNVCEIKIGGTPSRSIKGYYENGKNIWVSIRDISNNNGTYIYTSSEKITDEAVMKSNVKLINIGSVLVSFKLSIGKTAIAGTNLYTNEAIAGINSLDYNIMNNNYLYYLLTNTNMTKCGKGLFTNGSMNKKMLEEFEIPFPPLEVQNFIVKRMEFLDECVKTSTQKIEQLKELNKMCVEIYTKNIKDLQKLGDVCEFKNGDNITAKKLIDGEYPVIGGGKNPMGMHNKFNTNENTIIISKDGAYAGYVSKYPTKTFITNHGIYVNKINTCVIHKDYIYYYLQYKQNDLYKLQKGAAQPGVNKADIANLEIPLPPLEVQQSIINYCEANDKLIRDLQTEIEQNKAMAKEFIKSSVNLTEYKEPEPLTPIENNDYDNENDDYENDEGLTTEVETDEHSNNNVLDNIENNIIPLENTSTEPIVDVKPEPKKIKVKIVKKVVKTDE